MNKTKPAFTMVALVALFLGGTVWGFQLLTSSASTSATSTPTCENRTVKVGEALTTNFVTVNVYNSGQRSGQANRVQINLQRNGFLAGKIGNNAGELKSKTVTIITNDSKASEVVLVAKQFENKVSYEAPTMSLEQGVTIVVGDDYSGLQKKPARSVKASKDITVCVPIDPAVKVD